jgi:hypothetical protein
LKFKNLPPFPQWPTHPPNEPLPTARVPELDIEDLHYLKDSPQREALEGENRSGTRSAENRYRNTFFGEQTA